MNSLPDCLSYVTRETAERILLYRELILRWQPTINLIADTAEINTRHLADSAQLAAFLPREKCTVMDMGSGAGFPGLMLSLLTPHKIHLVESDTRKAAFLSEAVRITSSTATVHCARVQEVLISDIKVIIARALAPLPSLLALAHPHLAQDAFCLFPKGKNWSKEVEDARAEWRFELVSHPSQTEAESAVLAISHLAPRKP